MKADPSFAKYRSGLNPSPPGISAWPRLGKCGTDGDIVPTQVGPSMWTWSVLRLVIELTTMSCTDRSHDGS